MFSHFHEAEINSYCSYDKKSNTNEVVYPSELFEEKIDTNQHIVRRQFHDDTCDLISNHLMECEENVVYVQSNLWSIDIASEEKLDFTFSSYPEAQGELQSDSCNSLNEVEYQAFVFLVEGTHDLVSGNQFQFDVSCYDHTESFFHSELDEESMFDFCMHYEDNDSSFVLPNELIKSVDVLGETIENENFSLPWENVNEN